MSDIWFLVYAHVHHGCQNFATLNKYFMVVVEPCEYNIRYRRILHPVVFVVGRLALKRDIYPRNITLACRYRKTKKGTGKQVDSKLH